MFAKPQSKKRKAAGRRVSRPAALSPCRPPGGPVFRSRRGHRAARGRIPPLAVAAVVAALAAGAWLSWRVGVAERRVARQRARVAELAAVHASLAARVKRLGRRQRVERLAAARGLFPPVAGQKDTVRLERW